MRRGSHLRASQTASGSRVIERLEPRILFNINDYLLAFTSGINLVDTGANDERGGIFVMRPNGTQMRQITKFSTHNFQFSGDGLNLPDDHPSFSPDGKKIVFTSSRAVTTGVFKANDFDIYTMDPNGGNVKRLTFNSALDTEPAFSPDGTKIAFSSNRVDGQHEDLFVMNADGTNPVRLTSFAADDETEPAWSPDGTKIAFTRVTDRGVAGVLFAQKDLYVMNADGSNIRQLTNLNHEEHDPSWSPDGKSIAITSERGKLIPKRPFGDTVIISATDGHEIKLLTDDFKFSAGDPNWSPDGSTIAVFKADQPILAGALVIYTMNADGTNKQRHQAPGLISVHPAWGKAVDSDQDGVLDYQENANLSFDQDAVAGARETGSLMGTANALADLNHDGFLDVVTGLPGDDILGKSDAGRVTILRGSAQGPDFSSSIASFVPPTVNAGFVGQLQAGGHFGQTLAAGDFNGDGFKDLAIGAPGQNRVFIMLGATGPFRVLTGANGDFGAALTVGDFNHDGRADLAVGSPGEVRGGVAAGAVRIYFGSASGLSTAPQIIDQSLLPSTDAGALEAGDRFGGALATGTVNGDFFSDLIVGVPGEDITGVVDAGMLYAIPGRALASLLLASAVARDGRNLPAPFTGLQTGANFGDALTAGDFNGDIFRTADIAVGISRQDVNGVADYGLVATFGGSVAGTFSLATVATAFTAQQAGGPAPTASLRFGQSLVAADFTGDVVDDLAVAAPGQSFSGVSGAGIVYLVSGTKNTPNPPSGLVVNVGSPFGVGGGLIPSLAQQITPVSVQFPTGVNDQFTAGPNDHFGGSQIFPSANVLAAGDIDKDGQADLIIGTPEHDFRTVANSGLVSIRYGIKVGTATVTPSAATLPEDGKITYKLTWTHPDLWRDLTTLQLRIVGDNGVVAWIKWDAATNLISIGDPKTGLFSTSGLPGSNRKLRIGDVELDLRHTSVIGSGPTGKSMTLTLPLKLTIEKTGKSRSPVVYKVEVYGTDTRGNSNGFEQVATLGVQPGCGHNPVIKKWIELRRQIHWPFNFG